MNKSFSCKLFRCLRAWRRGIRRHCGRPDDAAMMMAAYWGRLQLSVLLLLIILRATYVLAGCRATEVADVREFAFASLHVCLGAFVASVVIQAYFGSVFVLFQLWLSCIVVPLRIPFRSCALFAARGMLGRCRELHIFPEQRCGWVRP